MDDRTVARFESKSGKHWVELDYTDTEKFGRIYGYKGPDCMGGYGAGTTVADALAQLAAEVSRGNFQPGANKTPMRLVFTAPGVALDTELAGRYAARDAARWAAFLETVTAAEMRA